MLDPMQNFMNHDPFSEMDAPIAAASGYLHGLNEPQRKAVETLDGPVLILAGAGTGKTRALTSRLAHLLHTGTASPGQILMVTFTNKAAQEMRERVSHLLGGADVSGWWIGTFHSLASRMLRRHAEWVGLRSNFTIIDDDDQLRLLKQIMELQNIDTKTINPKLILAIIDRWKNQGLTPERIEQLNGSVGDLPQAVTAHQVHALYAAYQQRLLALNACDFGDLLLHMVTIFRKADNGVLAQFHARFTHIMVDEYQDTNGIQYQFLRLLAQARKNICCVGDDDQSIYSWRGADVQNILNFEKDFPEATIIRLEQNYRSTKPILAAANALIAHNNSRLGKELWTDVQSDENVRITVAMDHIDEARIVSEEIEALQLKKISADDMAVLVRASSQMRAFEERFNAFNIPYRVIGGPRFYERLEIRDAMAYFRLIHQMDDDLAFARIINTPKRGLGAKTIADLQDASRRMLRGMFSTVQALVETDELKPSPRATLKKFVDDMLRWRTASTTMAVRDFAALVLEESGYVDMWRQDKSVEAAGRLDNLKELINAMSSFESLASFLDHVALVMENQSRSEQPRVTLMTLHAAKGLEYDYVFLPGWEEGLFPNQRSMDDTGLAGLEEERRLAYVGLTRAKQKAVVTYALRRQTYGEYNETVPSRFIEELPAEFLQDDRQLMTTRWGQYGDSNITSGSTSRWGQSMQSGNGWQGGGWGSSSQRQNQSYAGLNARFANGAKQTSSGQADTGQTSAGGFKKGQRVFHEKFGYGRVMHVDADKLDVTFDKAGAKKVLDRFVKGVE